MKTTVLASCSGIIETTAENAGFPKLPRGRWRLKKFYLNINVKHNPNILENVGSLSCIHIDMEVYTYIKKFGRT